VPRFTDLAVLRAILETDRAWATYALGDLTPGYAEHAEWHSDGRAIALLYRAFETPVLFTLGPPEAVNALLDEISNERRMYLSIRSEILPHIKARYAVQPETPMWRMTLDPAAFRPAPTQGVARLGPADLPALQRLYADGETAGEAPDFFSPDMLARGVFSGIREGQALIAAAGTHLVSAVESVGAIGAVYTRRDRRGRGLAGRATGAVAAELLRMGLRTIALNVRQDNAAAMRVYERLGFGRYCPFYEGVAVKETDD
jgi:ribosomal protein S18 acetylase RimI-like enzyme